MLAMTSAAANLSVQSSASVLLSAQDRWYMPNSGEVEPQNFAHKAIAGMRVEWIRGQTILGIVQKNRK
jgi:hypothetical protein